MSFFDFWRSTKERGAPLRKANHLRLNSSQLTLLLGDSEVRAVLQGERMVSLLPPVGMEVFRRFTVASLEEVQQQHEHEAKERKTRKDKKATEKNLPKTADHLETGKPLPFIYGDPPPQFLNTPLEDLDPFYQSKKVFMVLSNGNIINRFSADSSCYLLSPFNPLRTVAIKILLQPLFSLFILLTVLTNCTLPSWFPMVTYVCIAIYMFEALIKVVARGFCLGHFTFLRDPWNWLDIVIISTLLVSQFVVLGKFAVLMKCSLLLKIFTCSQGLKKTVEALVQSVKMLPDVIILTGLCLSIFAMIGLQFFMGTLKHKCVIWPMNMTVFDYDDYITSPGNYYYIPGHHDPLVCGNQSDAERCPEGFICLRGRNPNYGYTSYDSFFWSLLSLFRLMMQDYWENLMQLTLRAAGKSNVSIFVLVFFPGCFFLLSLILAVVAMTQVEQEESQGADAKQREEEFRQIVEVLKRREEEGQASSRTEILEEQDSVQKKKSATSVQANKQENAEETEEHHRPLCCTCSDPFLKADCCGCWQRLKRQFHIFIMNPFFDLVVIVCIIVSTIFAVMEHYPMTQFMDQLVIANLVFTGIFIIEMIIKLVALGLYGYFQVRWHIFDFSLVIISLAELILADVKGLSVLGLYFQLRVFRLARWWPMLHMFLKIIWASVGNLTLVIFITVFMFSVAGMELFQRDYQDNICRIASDCQLPRWHMHDFFHSFILVFRVLCGQWIENMWDCMEVSNDGVCVVFFLVVLIIGNLLILHLFLSLLFTNDQLMDREEKGSNNLQRTVKQTRTWILENIWTLQGKKKHADLDLTAGDTKKDNRKEYLSLSSVSSSQQILDDNCTNMAVHEAPVTETEVEFRMPENEQEIKKQHCDVVHELKDKTHTGNTPEDCCCTSCYLCCRFLETDTSQGTLRVLSNFRRASLCIVQHKFFEGFIVFIILLSCAALVFEDIYLEHRPILQRVLNTADLVFTFVFVVEMLLKWIAFGFKKYFTNFWCWLDFLILDVSLFSLMVHLLGYPSRPLRVLRTLRVPSRFKGMRMVLKALAVMLPSMFSVLLVILVIWFVFSIIGVNLFAGKFFHCYNETSEELFMLDQVNNKTECISLLEQNFSEVCWKNKKFNFDNVGMGFLSLLIMGTSSGWLDIMYAAVDSRQVEDQPLYESNLYMYLYFIGFIIIGCFFTLNIFIRVFIDTIHQHRQKLGGKHVFMTEEQQKYLRTIKKLFFEKCNTVPRPENWCLARLFELVTTLYSEIFMVVVICLNMVVLMVETDDQSVEKQSVMSWIHFIFVDIFLIEFILKIMALRKHYFRNGLNIIDFVVLIVSIGGLFLADIFDKYLVSPSLFPVFRLGRVFALFICRGTLHHIRCARKIWVLIMGFVMSLPALLNIGLLLFLIVYTFSIIGMFNFAYVKNEMMIDDMFNFKTFGNSIISVIMITTSSRWDGLLSPIMNQSPDCELGLPYSGNSANPAVGIVFFTSYILLFRLLMIHLFVVVILEIFNTASPEEAGDSEMLTDDHLQMFYKTWRRFDPNGSQVIQYSELADFCDALQDPLRIPKPNAIKLTHLNLPLFPGDQISCLDVLHEITTQVFGESRQVDTLKTKLDEIFRIDNQVSCEPVISTLPPQQTAEVLEKHVQDRNGEGTSVQTVGGSSQ